ncbi:MAG: hypothetical protein KGS45_13855 [Planctomycetes bacterium]|nr:hypothetical protein [Planctomycetota bacterium]
MTSTPHNPAKFKCARCVAAVLIAFTFAGCVEEKVIYNRPMLGSLPNAQTGQVVTAPKGWAAPQFGDGLEPQATGSDGKPKSGADTLVIERGKERIMLARSGRELMIHIYRALEKEDRRFFVDQVLSEKTRTECYQKGVKPELLFDGLLEIGDEVVELFNAMPQGEGTPGVLMKPIGGGLFRLEVDPRRVRDSRFQGFDMIMEKGQWRLKWFIEKSA